MDKNNYQKFKQHLKSGGLLHAFLKAFKYLIFITNKKTAGLRRKPERVITKGKIKVICCESGINIFCDNKQITKFPGLNVAINNLGNWINSSNARWQILKSGTDFIDIKLGIPKLGLEQFWKLTIEDSLQISWQVKLRIRKAISIDEICIFSLLDYRYKTWFNDYHEHDFPAFGGSWRDMYLGNSPVFLLGVRFPIEDVKLASLAIEPGDKDLLPFVRNSPLNDKSHAIGFRHTQFKAKDKCHPGVYKLFSGKIFLFEEDSLLDDKIDKIKESVLGSAIKKNINKPLPRPAKILLANLPWQRDGMWGVRAGSRWPHIKNETERDYLPFPFFLAYATALLKKHSIEADLIDAIADQMTEDKFLGSLSENNYDYLVSETSIPSFCEDLRLLEKISDMGIRIILCGPNHEIYNPQFMEEHPFINFVLYGEYEFSLLELMQCLGEKRNLSEVKGLIYREANTVVKTPKREPFDINLLPWPHRETLPICRYSDAPGEMLVPNVQMVASRGCPFGCQFCLWPQVVYQGCHYRVRDVASVVSEMEYLVKVKGFKSVYFDDDTFNIGKERILAICREIKKKGLNKVQWGIMARPDLMDEELLKNLKDAGLYSVKYGVESAVQELVDGIDKGMDLKKAEKMIRLTKKMGIKTHLTFTFGLPGETRETVEQTIQWAKMVDPFSVQFSIATPFPGTKYYDTLREKGLIVSNDHASYDGNLKSVVKTRRLEPLDLEIAKLHAYKVWFEHIRKKRGFLGDLKRFFYYAKTKGLGFARTKTLNYLEFILFKKNKSLKETDLSVSLKNKEMRADLKKLKESAVDMLLIQCPPWDVAMPPLGIAYLASNLKKAGYKTSVLDLNIILYNSAAQASGFLWEQKSFDWWADGDLFKDTWSRLKASTENIISLTLREKKFKYIGLSTSFTGINFCRELISMIKQKCEETKIIVGGWGCCDGHMRSLFPTELIDAFVVGEGEKVLPEVIRVFEGKSKSRIVPGAIFTKDNFFEYVPSVPIADMDAIAWPTFNEFDLSLYKYPILPLFSSRGCIGHCAFCNDWSFCKPYRFRSAQNIFNEIKYHIDNNRINVFAFKDLLCNGKMSELNSLCDMLITSKLKINWDSQAIARKEMNYKLLCKLRESGCSCLIYGVESFSNNVLKRMGKIFTKEIVEKVLKDTNKAGIAALINIIVGFPGETEEDFQETLEAIEINRKYIKNIGAVSVCLVNGNSELDLNSEEYGVVLSSDVKIRAKKWVSADGKNTYEKRRGRAEKIIDLLNKLGLSYDTSTL
jgi:radical SAM superfamily enzyme YgiQ (UPF0313 family)